MSDLTIHIKCSNDTKVSVTVSPTATIADLKKLVESAIESTSVGPIPADSQRLIYAGRVLKDDQTVESYKMADGHTVHLVKMSKVKTEPPAPAAPSPVSTTAANAPAAPDNTPVTAGTSNGAQPFNMFAGTGNAAGAGAGQQLPGLGAFRGLGFEGLGGLGGLGGMGGLPPIDDAMMEQVLNNPAVMQQMVRWIESNREIKKCDFEPCLGFAHSLQ